MNQRPLPPQGSALPTAPHPDAGAIIAQRRREVKRNFKKLSEKSNKNSEKHAHISFHNKKIRKNIIISEKFIHEK